MCCLGLLLRQRKRTTVLASTEEKKPTTLGPSAPVFFSGIDVVALEVTRGTSPSCSVTETTFRCPSTETHSNERRVVEPNMSG